MPPPVDAILQPACLHSPDPGTRERIRQLMRSAIEMAVAFGLPRPLFPFEPIDVVATYTQRQGESGLWFQLHDGRVFSTSGEPDTTNPDDYGN